MFAFEQLIAAGAVVQQSHVVYPTGMHGSVFVDTDALYLNTIATSQVAQQIADAFRPDGVEIVVGSHICGSVLAQWVSFEMEGHIGRKVSAVYCEQQMRTVYRGVPTEWSREVQELCIGDKRFPLGRLAPGDEVIVRRPRVTISSTYRKMIAGRRALIVEPVLYVGDHVRYTVDAVRAAGGTVAGVACICNIGGITQLHSGNPARIYACSNVAFEMHNPDVCPLCHRGIAINTAVGMGREYLEMKRRAH